MLFNNILGTATLLLSCNPLVSALLGGNKFHYIDPKWAKHAKRAYLPKPATNVSTFTTPTGVKISYKEPGEAGICETTPGVKSFTGYISLTPVVHVFFWFFESRSSPANDPLTIWLNGGPGSDSLIGLFQENGPCRVTPDLNTTLNPYSWNDVSNMLYISQPVGTGFSYQEIANGSQGNNGAGIFLNGSSSKKFPEGTFPILDPDNIGNITTTRMAAIAAWHVLQGFLSGYEKLGAVIGQSKEFNLWTESYGGHYAPGRIPCPKQCCRCYPETCLTPQKSRGGFWGQTDSFFNYFRQQNAAIQNGSMPGYPLNFNTVGIGNGIISEYIQAPYYPEFAVNNTYGIKAYNDTVYNYAKFAAYWPNGCLAQIQGCILASQQVGGVVSVAAGQAITQQAVAYPEIDAVCSEAQDMCRDNVETPYYVYGGRGAYDIRHPYNDATPPKSFIDYLNQAYVQDAIGVSVNYTDANDDIATLFQSTGDFIYPNFLADLEAILDAGVRVSLYYGDADYICNWFGGQAVSLGLKYTHSAQFAKAGYAPLMYGGTQYGEVREYGNFSFTRVYESGHEVPYYQPQAALAIFNRTLQLVDIATGLKKVTDTLGSTGPVTATHTEPAPTLAAASGAAHSMWAASILKSYESDDLKPLPSSLSAV